MTDKKKALAKAIIADFRNKKQRDPKDEQELTQFVEEQGGEKYLQKMQDKLTKAALHGAKLNYIKSLKNQCAEDEEVIYFKSGGQMKCGCQKKEGGEVTKAESGWQAKFKNRKQQKEDKDKRQDKQNISRVQAKREVQPQKNQQWTNEEDRKLDSLVMRKEYYKKPLTRQGEKDLKDLKEKFKNSSNKNKFELQEEKCGGKVKKKASGSKINKNCGGAVAKFKMHRQGGSLNGIPFIRKAQ